MATPTGLSKEQWDAIIHSAVIDGVVATTATTAVSAALAVIANKYHAGFRNSLSLSGKVATVISPSVFVFWWQTQTSVVGAKADLSKVMEDAEQRKKHFPRMYGLPIHQAAANWVFDNPFKFIAAVGTTTVGSIFALEHFKNPTMKLSSRLMHTRVYSQGIVVSLLCGTMMFSDWMKRRGRFVAPDEEPDLKVQIPKVVTVVPEVYDGPLVPGELPIHQALANWLFDNPFKFIVGAGGTAVSAVFAYEHIANPTMKLSSRIMHTRVYTQGIVITVLCGTMIFTDYMRRHGGKFVAPLVPADPRLHVVAKEHPSKRRWDLYLPLMYAPLLPLIRIALKDRVPQHVLDRIFLGAVFAALSHAGYVIFSDSSV